MSKVEAIKTYFSTPERAVVNKEILELRKSMTEAEWLAFAGECAKALGVTLDAN